MIEIKKTMKNIILLFMLLVSVTTYGQEFKIGKEIFEMNCSSCHKMEQKLVGPSLQNTISEQGRDWTKKWINNSQSLIQSGDKHANDIYNEYDKMAMPAYAGLFSGEELESLLTYLQDYSINKEEEVKTTEGSTNENNVVSNPTIPNYLWILLGVTIILVILAIFVLKMALDSVLVLIGKSKNDNLDSYIETEVSNRLNEKIKNLKKKYQQKLR